MQGSLAKIKSVAAWDGQDAKEEVVEEFSLDDIMADEDEGAGKHTEL